MRRIIICLVVLATMIGAGSVHAQFRYGPVAGVDFTDLNFKQNLITVDESTGFSAGIMGEMMFPGIGFGLDIGLMYVQRGATLHLGEKRVWAYDGYGTERSYLHYVDIPLNLRFKYTRLNGIEDYVAPFVFGGPSLSFLVAHSSIHALEYARGEFGLSVGGGLEIMRNWQVSASYTWGMSYALKTRLLDDFSAKNRTLNIRLAYLF
ncbi:MAG: PorT family protein [Muribaculaceae bacterium]|nr:PorT family protein [Muribaculaceae bacterium]